MKRSLRWFYKTLILATGVMLFACNSTGEDTPDPQDLPSFKDLTVLVGDNGSLTFNASSTWTISADKIWFKIAQQTGVAGAQELTYEVTDGGVGFQDQTAEITFAMGGLKTSFKATRVGKERSLTLLTYVQTESGLEPQETEQINLIYTLNANTYTSNFAVRTNFAWKVSFPEWITIDQENSSGEPNPLDPSPAYGWLSVNYAKAQAEDMAGEVVFTDLNVSAEPIVKSITCPGSKRYMMSNAAAALTISADGLYKPTSPGGEVIEPTNGYTFNAITGNDGVKFFRVARDAGGWYGVTDENWNLDFVARWCNIENDGATKLGDHVEEGAYWLGCRFNDADKRFATIVALPEAMAAGLTEKDLVAMSEKDIKEEYQPYIVTELTQEALSGGIEFSMGTAPEGITLEEMPAGDERDGIQSEYGTELIYVMTFDSFANASMAMLDYKGYEGEYELMPIYVPSENDMTQPQGWFSFMAGIGQYMTVDISDQKAPFTGSRSTLVVCRNSGTYMNEFAIKVVQNVKRD